jgi:hypothetical protein
MFTLPPHLAKPDAREQATQCVKVDRDIYHDEYLKPGLVRLRTSIDNTEEFAVKEAYIFGVKFFVLERRCDDLQTDIRHAFIRWIEEHKE